MSKIEVDAIEPQSGTNLTVGASGDTVTVTNNDIRSDAYKASDGGNLVSQSGTTITLGASGDTVTIASGATLVGGGTDWQSTVKTSTFTAVAGEGYFVNCSGGAVTMNLPAGVVGAVVEAVDAGETFSTNTFTVSANGSEKIQGSTDDITRTKNQSGIRLVYSGSTNGWVIPTSNEGIAGPYSVDFLVIAAGGGTSRDLGGGGGAGGYRASYNSEASGGGGSSESSLSLTRNVVYTVSVGAGGAARSDQALQGGDGGDSSLSGTGITTVTSVGGGGGGCRTGPVNGRDGGSGGGCPYNTGSSGGAGTSNQGYAGGGNGSNSNPAAGGGGAGAVGQDAAGGGGNGGTGVASTITGSSVTRAGGGGGGSASSNRPGGSGGGGAGGNNTENGSNGSTNTGSGAGGGGNNSSSGSTGGSGVVILRMLTSDYSGISSGSATVTTDGVSTILTFTGSGSYTA